MSCEEVTKLVRCQLIRHLTDESFVSYGTGHQVKRDRNQRRRHRDWETIFHGSRRRVSAVIIGCEADFWSRKPISKEERGRLIRRLKEYVNLSYDSEATIAKQIGADEGALNGWLAGKVKPTFQSLLKVQKFLECQVETGGGIAPIGYSPLRPADLKSQRPLNGFAFQRLFPI